VYTLDVKSGSSASVIGKDTLAAKFSYDGKLISLSFAPPDPEDLVERPGEGPGAARGAEAGAAGAAPAGGGRRSGGRGAAAAVTRLSGVSLTGIRGTGMARTLRATR